MDLKIISLEKTVTCRYKHARDTGNSSKQHCAGQGPSASVSIQQRPGDDISRNLHSPVDYKGEIVVDPKIAYVVGQPVIDDRVDKPEMEKFSDQINGETKSQIPDESDGGSLFTQVWRSEKVDDVVALLFDQLVLSLSFFANFLLRRK